MTWAYALVMLARMGYPHLARGGCDTQRFYLEEAVNLDPEGCGPKITTGDYPFTAEYWSKDFEALDRN